MIVLGVIVARSASLHECPRHVDVQIETDSDLTSGYKDVVILTRIKVCMHALMDAWLLNFQHGPGSH
jgi:hypothetical protein